MSNFKSYPDLHSYREACLEYRYEIFDMKNQTSMFVDELPQLDSEYYNPENFLIYDKSNKN